MISPSRRRIVRRAVMALAVVVLVPVGYVSSCLSFHYAQGADWLPLPVQKTANRIYWPLHIYAMSDWSGAKSYLELIQWASDEGSAFRLRKYHRRRESRRRLNSQSMRWEHTPQIAFGGADPAEAVDRLVGFVEPPPIG